MASATFVPFFAVTYTAMITRMINGELNYRIPASQQYNETSCLSSPLCHGLPFLSLTPSFIISQTPTSTANFLQSKRQYAFVHSDFIFPSRPRIQHVENHTLDLHRSHVHVYKHLV
jgi:hypothetical protein